MYLNNPNLMTPQYFNNIVAVAASQANVYSPWYWIPATRPVFCTLNNGCFIRRHSQHVWPKSPIPKSNKQWLSLIWWLLSTSIIYSSSSCKPSQRLLTLILDPCYQACLLYPEQWMFYSKAQPTCLVLSGQELYRNWVNRQCIFLLIRVNPEGERKNGTWINMFFLCSSQQA